MADNSIKWEDNVGGISVVGDKKVSFYTDKECIFCALCHGISPENFKQVADGDVESHDIVYKQPETEEELELCYEALDECPVNAIGDDGENI